MFSLKKANSDEPRPAAPLERNFVEKNVGNSCRD